MKFVVIFPCFILKKTGLKILILSELFVLLWITPVQLFVYVAGFSFSWSEWSNHFSKVSLSYPNCEYLVPLTPSAASSYLLIYAAIQLIHTVSSIVYRFSVFSAMALASWFLKNRRFYWSILTFLFQEHSTAWGEFKWNNWIATVMVFVTRST